MSACLEEKELPQKPQRKSWKNALTAVSGLLRKSWSQLPLQHTKRLSFSKSLEENLALDTLDTSDSTTTDFNISESKTKIISDVTTSD